jgi:hypothetical protein
MSSGDFSMRVTAFALSACFVATAAFGQSNWSKTYSVSGKPAVQIDVDDASVVTRSCGSCRAVNVRVDSRGADMSRWHVTEMQGGNSVHFSMKHREEGRLFLGWHDRSPQVLVDVPTESDLNVRSGDGSLSIAGVHGVVDVKTGDGSIQMDDTAGSLRVATGNGSVQVRSAEGTMTASTGDGSLNLEGRLSQVDARSGDGSIHISLLPGSVLQTSSRITTGDGSITMKVPRDIRADVELATGDGSIRCDLPMVQSTFLNNRHLIRASVNGGGVSLHLRSGDGSILLTGR